MVLLMFQCKKRNWSVDNEGEWLSSLATFKGAKKEDEKKLPIFILQGSRSCAIFCFTLTHYAWI